MTEKRLSVKFAGQSGKGINTLGKILSKTLKSNGHFNFAYREYPSLIKGGVAAYQIDIADTPIQSSSRYCDILPLVNSTALDTYIDTLAPNGVLIYGKEELNISEEQKVFIESNNISLLSLDTTQMALDAGGEEIMANMVLLGFLCRLLELDPKPLEEIVVETFKNKDVDLEAEVRCVRAGFNSDLVEEKLIKGVRFEREENWKESINITCNQALSLGAISGGCRAYYAYPMTPSTGILKYLGDTYKETGMLVKQAENEITAAQMAMGSMAMGTRAMVATSGGGFDLMTETISCAGISETPLLIVLGQRAGAGTGVPTWTGASDIAVALYGGHGEFPRCVISVSNPEDTYLLIQEAFNIGEEYQMPVILLTEKQNAESIFNIENLPQPIEIKRGLSKGEKRYEITESGISPRWIPSKQNPIIHQSSDEHKESGESTEHPEEIVEMTDKRMRKLETLKEQLPEPEYFGSNKPKVVFVGYGSVGNTLRDVCRENDDIGYLHYQYIYPLKYEKLLQTHKRCKRMVLIENNQTALFGKLIKQECGFDFAEKLIKYDARPFFIEDILDFLNK